MSGIDLSHATAITPHPGPQWLALSEAQKLTAVNNLFKEKEFAIEAVSANEKADVTVEISPELDAAARGEMLRKAEKVLKQHIDESLVLWLPTETDRNTIRRFRGVSIDVKQER